ncbi:conserved protein of unknown function [Acidithiobacillus ferrivorans]|uniref:Uncharacterized protein n=2 Tax=Acidithiobacillus ferrivorans TaxID=160808 RepID=A0A060UNG0_9PROT|nr:conserved hypothetical protein [Acidithiobacillus ferrivorans]SMH64140.1 conserved protein of unknown function [Acidithiobacillus ferrivorans]
MVYSMKSPLALYRAFSAANVPDDIARNAAYAVSADLEAMIDQLVTELESRSPQTHKFGNLWRSPDVGG